MTGEKKEERCLKRGDPEITAMGLIDDLKLVALQW